MGRDGREIFAASSVLQTTREVTRAIKRLKRGGPQRECILFRLLFHECNQGQDFPVSSANRKVRNEDVRRIENEPISASLSRLPMSESATFFTLSVSRLSCQSRRNSASRVLPLFFLLAAAPGRTGSHILPTSVCPLSQFDILHERGRRRSKALNLLLFPSDVGK